FSHSDFQSPSAGCAAKKIARQSARGTERGAGLEGRLKPGIEYLLLYGRKRYGDPIPRATIALPEKVTIIKTAINKTPSAEAAGRFCSSSQRCHSMTASGRLVRPASISGTENARTACAATQIHAAMKAGRIKGKVICHRTRSRLAPAASPASSSSLWICVTAAWVVLGGKETYWAISARTKIHTGAI